MAISALMVHPRLGVGVIPYGSLLYITSDDGKFVYGYAYAADTGTALVQGKAFIDLYYETYANQPAAGPGGRTV